MENASSASMRLYNSIPSFVKKMADELILTSERAMWYSGDLSLDMIAEQPFDSVVKKPYSKTEIRMAVAYLFKVTESTIRSREYVCELVDEEMRMSYPLVSYNMWRACSGVKPRDNSTKKAALMEKAEEIMSYYEAYEQLPSVDTIRSWNDPHDKTREVWELRLASLISLVEKICADESAPAPIRVMLRDCMVNIIVTWAHGAD